MFSPFRSFFALFSFNRMPVPSNKPVEPVSKKRKREENEEKKERKSFGQQVRIVPKSMLLDFHHQQNLSRLVYLSGVITTQDESAEMYEQALVNIEEQALANEYTFVSEPKFTPHGDHVLHYACFALYIPPQRNLFSAASEVEVDGLQQENNPPINPSPSSPPPVQL